MAEPANGEPVMLPGPAFTGRPGPAPQLPLVFFPAHNRRLRSLSPCPAQLCPQQKSNTLFWGKLYVTAISPNALRFHFRLV